MGLFSCEELGQGRKPPSVADGTGLKVFGTPFSPQAITAGADIRQLAAQALKSASLIFLSEGKLSVHHLLEALLMEAGPARVWLSCYAITEEPARRILRLRQSGHIRHLSCLLDAHLARNNAKAYQLLCTTADVTGTAPIHAKCFVLQGDSFQISVMGSANLSNNPRLELTHTSTAGDVAAWYISWLEEWIQKGRVK